MPSLRELLNSGLSPDQSVQQRRTIIIVNYLSVILPCIVLTLMLYRIFVIGSTRILDLVTIATLLFIPLLFNRLKLPSVAQILICLIPLGFLWYTAMRGFNARGSVDIFMYDGLRLYLLATGIFPYLIFNWSRPTISLVCVAPTLLTLVFMDDFFSLMAGTTIAAENFGLLPIRAWIAYVIISSGALVLQYIIFLNDMNNEKLVTQLKAKNEELEDSRRALNSVNLHLEGAVSQKTRTLKVKNAAIMKYAYANAHHIRGPLARILGLIQISKIDNASDIHDLFEKVKSETESMDDIVRGISRELDNLSSEED